MDTDEWIEVKEIPTGVKPLEFLKIPNHRFVRRSVLKRLREEGRLPRDVIL